MWTGNRENGAISVVAEEGGCLLAFSLSTADARSLGRLSSFVVAMCQLMIGVVVLCYVLYVVYMHQPREYP